MALPVEKLGTKYDERTSVLDPERAKHYAAATNDGNPAYGSGKFAPPVFHVDDDQTFDDGVYGFEAVTQNGDTVISNGRAEVEA